MCHILGFENSVLSEITSLQISSIGLMKFQPKPQQVYEVYMCVYNLTNWLKFIQKLKKKKRKAKTLKGKKRKGKERVYLRSRSTVKLLL